MDAQRELMSAQTVFMESQTARLEEQTAQAAMQNEIMTLSLVNQLREQMLASIEIRPLGEWLQSFGLPGVGEPLVQFGSADEACGLQFDLTHLLSSQPGYATLGAIEALAANANLGDRVISALKLLTRDSNGGVALGALLVLEAIGQPQLDGEVILRNVMVSEPVFLGDVDYQITFRASYAFNLHCPDCNVHVGTSVFFQRAPHRLSGFGNIFVTSVPNDPLNGVTLARRRADLPKNWNGVPLEKGTFFIQDYRAWLTQIGDGTTCEKISEIARINPLLMPVSR